jgi:hypothetical protein
MCKERRPGWGGLLLSHSGLRTRGKGIGPHGGEEKEMGRSGKEKRKEKERKGSGSVGPRVEESDGPRWEGARPARENWPKKSF